MLLICLLKSMTTNSNVRGNGEIMLERIEDLFDCDCFEAMDRNVEALGL